MLSTVPVYRSGARVLCRRSRLLPLEGEVVVRVGTTVQPTDLLAEALVPGEPQVVAVAAALGVEGELSAYLLKQPGDAVRKGEVLAERKTRWGLSRKTCLSPLDGTVESAPNQSGELTISPFPDRIELPAGLPGMVCEVIPRRGAVIETEAVSVQGIAGLGEDTGGPLRILAGPNQAIAAERVTEECRGAVVVGGSLDEASLVQLRRFEVRALVVGSLPADLFLRILAEKPSFSLVVTEGFGAGAMDARAFASLEELENRLAVVFPGADSGSAGFASPMPELIVPVERKHAQLPKPAELAVGAAIRVTTGAACGRRGIVASVSTSWTRLPSGEVVRTLPVQLEGQETARVPLRNLELLT